MEGITSRKEETMFSSIMLRFFQKALPMAFTFGKR